MNSKVGKIGVAVCAVALAGALSGCATSTTPVGPAGTADSVTARSSEEMEQTAAILDKQSDNDTMGGKGIESVSLGQEVSTDTYSFTLTSYEYVDVVEPGASGDTAIYMDQVNRKYLVVHGTYTNKSDTAQNIRKGTAAWFTFDSSVFPNNRDEYGIQGWTDVIESDGTAFSNFQVEPGETVDMFVYAEVVDSVASSAKSAHVLWGFNNVLDDYSYYEAATEGAAYDVTIY